MRREDLKYQYPSELIATERVGPSRVAYVQKNQAPRELSVADLRDEFRPGDLLIINNTAVENRRIFAGDKEILFLEPVAELEWQVLFAARGLALGSDIDLPGGVTLTLVEKGLPQRVRVSRPIGAKYFAEFGEPALPPYIQAARGERHARRRDFDDYQSAWAKVPGSSAAPTASLHFNTADLAYLTAKGVQVAQLTLHVGLGTFLPVKVDDLAAHRMHHEQVVIPAATRAAIARTKAAGGEVWALGTTVTRALESDARGLFHDLGDGDFGGSTDLFITPGFDFRVVDNLLTNFHQPESTLLALVAAFAGLERTRAVYAWAIERRFRLFSYGDLSVWRGR